MIDIIIERIPEKTSSKEWMDNLKSIIDNKLSQMAVKTTGFNNKQQSKFEIINQNCDSIVPIIKNVISKKPGSSTKGKKSLTNVILSILESFEESKTTGQSYTFMKARELLHKACQNHFKKPKMLKKINQLPPLYLVGGTALGGLAPLPKVKAPFLPDDKERKEYTLVLDLDETLVHYYEINGKGKYNVRPN